jgi:hypothetical protein
MSDWLPLTAPYGDKRYQRPFIDVIIIGPSGREETATALVDTSSSTSVFPIEFLESADVDFDGPRLIDVITGYGTTECHVGTPETIECEFAGHVATVTAYGSHYADLVMLGVDDFLSYFDLTINKARNRFQLTPASPSNEQGK